MDANVSQTGIDLWSAQVLSANETVAYSFDRNDLQAGIIFEVSTQFGNINIQIAAIEKGVISPEQCQNIFATDNSIAILI